MIKVIICGTHPGADQSVHFSVEVVGLVPEVGLAETLGSRESDSGPPINSSPPRFCYLPVL